MKSLKAKSAALSASLGVATAELMTALLTVAMIASCCAIEDDRAILAASPGIS
jgi:hypothetical protein